MCASATHRDASSRLYEQFSVSRHSGSSRRVQTTQSTNIVELSCSFFTRVTTANGSPSVLEFCSTVSGEHILPFAHDSLRANYVSKLSGFYERDLQIISDWSSNLHTGNPARGTLATSYIAVSREEQKKVVFLL